MIRPGDGAARSGACASIVALGVFAACSRTIEPGSPATLAPDVVILLADDLGWADVGYHAPGSIGSPEGADVPGAIGAIATPQIDALARSGLRLERYCTAPLCTPSRAGLLTGRSPLRLGLQRNVVATDSGGLPLEEELLPVAFARAGYATAMVGKWHLGHSRPEQRPNARGFERFYGFLSGWIDYSTHAHDGVSDWWRDGRPIREEGYSTHLLAKEAVRILSERGRTRPLLLYVAFNAPHPPVHVPPGGRLDEPPGAKRIRRSYERMVAELDRAVGEILNAIGGGERARETVVFFASDNGADPRYGGSNAPLREGKYDVFEGGIRVPAVLWWPGRVKPGASERLITHLDALPTIAGLAGIVLDPARPLDGRNMWPELSSGAGVDRDPAAFGVQDGEDRAYALVGERWKLVETQRRGNPPTDLLFDLAADPREERDLSGEERGKLAEMRALLEPWKAMPQTLPPIPAQR